MFNVCYQCGAYRADKTIDASGAHAACPECGHAHPFRRLPLCLVSGASGSGKSAVLGRLLGRFDEAVLLESDILWRSEYTSPEQVRGFFETWLRLCKNIGQAGRPVVLFGAGMGVASNIEPCVERRYFARVHYLALTCDDEILAERLRSRPAYRGSATSAYLDEHTRYNRWLKENGPKAEPAATLLDTTARSADETAGQVAIWIRHALGQP